jgi:hypothetical protein
MADKIVSPGVFTRENDLSFLAEGVGSIGAAIIGPFKEGPLYPVVIQTIPDFETLFGRVDDTYYSALTAQAYLREAGLVTICRVAGVGGYTEPGPVLITATTNSINYGLGVLFNTSTTGAGFTTGWTVAADGTTVFSSSAAQVGEFLLPSGSLFGQQLSASINPAATDAIDAVFGTNPVGQKTAYTFGYFKNAAVGLNYASNLTITGSKLGPQLFTYDAVEAKTPALRSQLISGQRYDMLRFVTLGAGARTNQKLKVTVSNVKAAGSISGTNYGSFTITVRDFADTNTRRTILEQYTNVNMDPTSPNFVNRVIGDKSFTIGTDGKVTEYGDWALNSKYIRVWNNNDAGYISPTTIPIQAVPYAHAPYSLPVSASAALATRIPAATIISASATVYGGIDLDGNTDNLFYMAPIATGAGTGSNLEYSLDVSNNYPLTGALSADTTKRNFIVAFQGGFDGLNPSTPINKGIDISATNSQGFDLSTSNSTGTTAYLKQINALTNADQYDINMVVTPGVIQRLHPSIVSSVQQLVEGRGDAFYIMDPTAIFDTVSQVTTVAQSFDSNYMGIYYPWIKTVDVNTNKLIAVPPSVLMPAVYAANDRIAAEWFAPAGLNRGGLTGAVSVLNKLTQAERDTLYENKVNPIAQFPGQGICAFGQKTLQNKPSALDRINVRRLLLVVRKYIASTSRYLTFEQNTATTRGKFLNIAQPYLESIQQRQGLYAFRVIMDDTNNTPDVIDRNILKGAIYLQPTKTAEFILIDFNILPTGATFGG